MSREQTVQTIAETGVVAVIRMKDPSRLRKVLEALSKGGVRCIEITMTVPGAVEIIRSLSASLPTEILLGAGTVTEASTAGEVIRAGAKFVVGPVLNPEMISLCHEEGVAVIPGCLSPTEIHTARKAGADIIKVFPATSLGPTYFRDLRGPFPDLRLMPTGGVTIDNAGEWITAGATAVGIGSDLLDQAAIARDRFDVLTQRAHRLMDNVSRAQQVRKGAS